MAKIIQDIHNLKLVHGEILPKDFFFENNSY